MYRLHWPAEALRRQGHDVRSVLPGDRDFRLDVDRNTGHVRDVLGDPEAHMDVCVFQRLTSPLMAQVPALLRARGIAVVMDMDDDLSAVHPSNPAFAMMHPARAKGSPTAHAWSHLALACRESTLVTVSSPALLARYARPGRGVVLPNCLPEPFFAVPHVDSGTVGWPASLHSHPDDPSAVGGAVARLVADGADFRIVGHPVGTGAAFGLPGGRDPQGSGDVDLAGWPAAVAVLGIGIAPLADTRFNAGKSWLKPLEMSAVGVPWVGSPRAEYARLHALGAGVLADNPRRWYRELARLRGSEAARTELSESGRAAVAHLRIETQAWRWLEAWTEAWKVQRAESSTVTPRRGSDTGAEPSMSSSSSADLPSSATV